MVDRAPWYLAGPLIGLVIVGLLWVANKPLGALGGYLDLEAWARQPTTRLGWRAWFVIGVVIGGLVFAMASGGLHVSTSYGGIAGRLALPTRLALLAGAGAFIGWGARTAKGCTSGHGLSGMALGSRASIVATMTFMTTAVVAAHVLAWIGGVS